MISSRVQGLTQKKEKKVHALYIKRLNFIMMWIEKNVFSNYWKVC